MGTAQHCIFSFNIGNTIVRKRIAVLATVVVLLVAGSFIFKKSLDAGFYDGYEAEAPLNVRIRSVEEKDAYELYDLVFDGVAGMPVPTLLAFPPQGSGPFPCIIFLHGIGQSKGFMEEIAAPYTSAGFAFVSFDQYARGERKLEQSNVLTDALGLRRRCALNVIETRRLVDYLVSRPDIAPGRIYLIGASFGAITGATAVAFEPRIQAAVMTYGGGDFDKLLSSEAAQSELGIFHWPVKTLVASLTAPADPVRYVGRVAPRPLLFQNGTHDALIPLEAADALYAAAKDPKTRTLYESDHVGLDEATTRAVLQECLTWLESVDREKRAVETSVAENPESGA
ncbi:MAG: hypothetical protein AMXMBFR82_49530 [Candidatus Hydrogenedentota bacterium]